MGMWRTTGESFYTPDGKFDTQAYLRSLNREIEFREIERRALEPSPGTFDGG